MFPATEDEAAIVSMLAHVEDGEVDVVPADGPRLAAWLAHPHRALRRRAARALAAALTRGQIPPDVCEALLESEVAAERWGAAYALGRAGFPSARVIDVAVAALDAADGDVRWAAASLVIARARESAGLRARLRDLARGGSAVARKMALLCLCDSGEQDAGVYIAALADREALVRIAALTALARSDDRSPATLEAISATACTDDEAAVCRAANAVLHRLQSSAPRGGGHDDD